jgi:membrane protein DedA with SNARE-associated domain
MEEYQELYREFGLWLVFFGAMIEGDLTLLLAGFMARTGAIHFSDALLIGTSGGVAGDLIGYLIGRMFRSRARTLRFYMRAKPRLERLLRRFGGFSLFIVKYTYGLRTAMAVFCGLAHFGITRFAPLTMLSCIAWSLVLSGGGYIFADSVERLIGEIKSIEKILLVVAVLVGIVFLVKHLRRGRGIGE